MAIGWVSFWEGTQEQPWSVPFYFSDLAEGEGGYLRAFTSVIIFFVMIQLNSKHRMCEFLYIYFNEKSLIQTSRRKKHTDQLRCINVIWVLIQTKKETIDGIQKLTAYFLILNNYF